MDEEMKTLKYFLIICFAAQLLNAQSNITFSGGSSIDVALGADICADVITGTVTGDGTQCNLGVPKVLSLTALIEGFYNGVTMVQDTVTVQLRKAVSPFSSVEQKKVFLSSSGAGNVSFNSVKNDTLYYLVVRHRNSIETWSGTGKSFTSNQLSYNFTTAASQAFGNNMKLKASKWAIFSGDVNQDGLVDLSDVSLTDTDNLNFVVGYTLTDVNGDNLVDLSDLSIVDINNLNFVSKFTPTFTAKPQKIEVNTLR